jgi:2-polyprenyl-3-methyl-5-hydroxy-6-metoxy-1,4-benzoquinol methylase
MQAFQKKAILHKRTGGNKTMCQANKRPCPICQNSDSDYIRYIGQVENAHRIACRICGLIYFDREIKDLPVYDLNYNREFFRPGDIRKAGIMTEQLSYIMQDNFKHGELLEIGPGNGLTCFLLRVLGYDAKGVDIDRGTCEFLSKKFDIPVYHSDFLTWKVENRFDIIYAAQMIEHFDNPKKFFEQCKMLLNPKGILFIDTPDGEWGLRKGPDWHHFQTRHPFEHLSIFTTTTLYAAAFRYGFKLEKIISFSQYETIQAILRVK